MENWKFYFCQMLELIIAKNIIIKKPEKYSTNIKMLFSNFIKLKIFLVTQLFAKANNNHVFTTFIYETQIKNFNC